MIGWRGRIATLAVVAATALGFALAVPYLRFSTKITEFLPDSADRGAQMRHHVDEIVGRMLHVDEHPVEAGARDHLGRDRAGHAEPEDDLRRARCQRALEVVPRQIIDHGWALSYRLSAISPAKQRIRPLADG